MTKFLYSALDPTGTEVEGALVVKDRAEASKILGAQGMHDIRIEQKRGLLDIQVSAARVKREDVMHLSRQLGAFTRAGLPLIEAVHTLGVDAKNPTLRKTMAEIEEGLRTGDRLSDCLDRHPKVFPEFYRATLRSAELTGELDTVLTQLAKYLERDLEARRKVRAAMIYPGIIALLATITVTVLATFVLPKFKVFFKSLDAKLPLPTRMLLTMTDFLGNWWWALLAGVIGFVLLVAAIVSTEQGKYSRDKLFLATPVLGDTIQCALVERFCRVLASMVAAGVALPEAFRVTSASIQNLVFVRALRGVGEAMLEGEGIASPLVATGLFPTVAGQMMRVGEETGTLDDQLELTARYYEGELEYKFARLTSLIEPIVIVVMGLLVGFVAVALVSAMYGIFGQVKV